MNGYCLLFCDFQWANLQAKQVCGAPEAGEARPLPLEGVLERGEDEEEVPCRDDARVDTGKLGDGTSEMIAASKKDIKMCRLTCGY